MVEGESAGDEDSAGGAAASDGAVHGRGPNPDAAWHDGQNFGDFGLQVKYFLVLLRHRS